MIPLTDAEEIRPLYDRVLIEIPKQDERTKGGILLPDEIREDRARRECRAVILAMGSVAFADLPEDDRPEIGDIALIPRHAGRYYEHEGKTDFGLRIVRADECLALVRRKEA